MELMPITALECKNIPILIMCYIQNMYINTHFYKQNSQKQSEEGSRGRNKKCSCMKQTVNDLMSVMHVTVKLVSHVCVSRWDVSVITPAVVEAVCSSLLAQAEEAEMETQSLVWAEHMILDEFGHCLTQIVKAMSKYNTY